MPSVGLHKCHECQVQWLVLTMSCLQIYRRVKKKHQGLSLRAMAGLVRSHSLVRHCTTKVTSVKVQVISLATHAASSSSCHNHGESSIHPHVQSSQSTEGGHLSSQAPSVCALDIPPCHPNLAAIDLGCKSEGAQGLLGKVPRR